MTIVQKELKYTKTHEWVSLQGSIAKVGLTSYATEKMGKDLAYVEVVKRAGDAVQKGEEIALLDVVKTTEEVISPVTGKIIAVNTDLEDNVDILSEDPYGEGWVAEIEVASADELDGLLSIEEYEAELKNTEKNS